MYICSYIYVHILLYISTLHGSGPSRTLLRETRGRGWSFVDLGGLFIDKQPWGVLQAMGPNKQV